MVESRQTVGGPVSWTPSVSAGGGEATSRDFCSGINLAGPLIPGGFS